MSPTDVLENYELYQNICLMSKEPKYKRRKKGNNTDEITQWRGEKLGKE